MRKPWTLLVAVLLVAWVAFAQTSTESKTKVTASSNTSASAGKSGVKAKTKAEATALQETRAPAKQRESARLASGTTFEAVLTKPVDARKNKEGDPVVARTRKDVKSEGQVAIPKNSKLIGRVTRAHARAQGESESSLGIVFERAILRDGREMPIHVVVQAVAAAESVASAPMAETEMVGASRASGRASGSGASRGAAGGSLVGGVTSTAGATVGAVAPAAGGAVSATSETAAAVTGPAAGGNVAGALTSSSTGVIGLRGLTLHSEGSSAAQGSVITSPGRNVRLESGTRFMLRAVSK